VLRRDLDALNSELPRQFVLPLDPTKMLRRIKVEKCKYMDSKKLPLWLVFENADEAGDDYYVIFKAGDDLRQDVLTLQMINIMDRLWKAEGIDLKLSPYGCISTGDEVGLLEVVLNSETNASIAGSAMAEMMDNTIFTTWLKDQNRTPEAWASALTNYRLSTAGYCVATYDVVACEETSSLACSSF
jgi:phosphatidylinositol kinase/protein kinase (PI-3  family)